MIRKILSIPFAIILVAAAYYAFQFSFASIMDFESFSVSAYDVSLYDQAIWLMSRFMAPFTTIKGVFIFGDHASFYSVLLAPLYWIWPDTRALFIVQSVFLAAAVIPLFLYAARKLGNQYIALLVGLSYLLYPALQNMNLENFHPEAMIVLFFMWTLYFLKQRNFRFFYVFLFLSLIAKEDIGLTVVFLGIYVWLDAQDWKNGLITSMSGAAWYLLCSRLIMPLFNSINIFSSQPMVYSYWFNAGGNNLFSLMSRFLENSTKVYFDNILMPVAYLPLFAPITLMIGLPSFAINVISGSDYLRSVGYHYNYMVICAVFFALVDGFYFVSRILKDHGLARQIALGVMCFALAFFSYQQNNQLSGLPLQKQIKIILGKASAARSENAQAARQALLLIPDNATISASYLLASHLVHRKETYMFPCPYSAVLWNMWFKEGKDIPAIGRQIQYLALMPSLHTGQDLLIIDYLRHSPYYKEIFNQRNTMILKNTPYQPMPEAGANFVSYVHEKGTAINDDFSKKLKIKQSGIFSMLYFPDSAYYFRNLMGEEIAVGQDGIALEIFGYFFVPENSEYKFDIQTNGQYLMEIDSEQKVIPSVYLKQGFHKYKIKYLNTGQKYGFKMALVPLRGKAYILPDEHLTRAYDPNKFGAFTQDYNIKARQRQEFLSRQPNLVLDGSFENPNESQPGKWKLEYWKAKGSTCVQTVDTQVKKQGQYSLKLDHLGQADSRWVQDIDVNPDTYYKLSGWIRTTGVSREGRGAFLMIDNPIQKTEVVFGTQNWKQVEIMFKTDSDQTKVRVLARLGDYGMPTKGIAYFDDIILKKVLDMP